MSRVLAIAFAMSLAYPALAQAPPSGTGPTQHQLDIADTDAAHWLTANKGYLGYRYSALSAINTSNVGQVKVLCTAALGFDGAFQTGPIEFAGVLYATAGLTTYAIDATTCASLWSYTYPGSSGGSHNRGLALAQGRLFRGASDHLLALDAKTGALLWDRQVMDGTLGENANGAPLAWGGLVFVGKAGGDKGIQGEVMALRQSDGSLAWGFHTVPNPGDFGSDTWPDAFSIAHGGGATWTAFALDEARGLLLFPVGNPGPDNNKSLRPGRNLFTSSVVALDAGTGALSWYHQLLPGDDRDWDTTIAAAMPTAGGLDIAVAAGKDGVLHMVDRADGRLLHTVPLVQNYLNTTTRVPRGTGLRLCPIAAVQWSGPSYSPATNLLYMPGIDWCSQVIQGPVPTYAPGQPYAGWVNTEAGSRDPIGQAFGLVNAIDVGSGALVWRARTAALPLGGLVATGGGVVAVGEINGDVAFLDARTGTALGAVNVGQPIGGGVVSYAVAGRQRIAVAAGITSKVYGTSGTATLAVLGIP